ncbi:MAG: hypothetical protein ISS23_01365 [Nanoarchaeota archaeon]|nr:hypothetical protein [Nanoarchaeota archaeon]
MLFKELRNYEFKGLNNLFFNNRLNWNTFKQWKQRKNFIPLWFIVELSKKFPEFSIQKFEENILAYKGPSNSSIIKNPKLPLKENKSLLRILAHLLGDGYVGGGFGTKLPKGKQSSEYRNFNHKLLEIFNEDLSVFGDVPTTLNLNHGSLIIPNLIGYILSHIYEINFDTFSSRLPKDIFILNPGLIAYFLRAFGDDEGHVYDSSIDYYSSNKDLIQDILILINKSFPEIRTSDIKSNIKAGKNTKYSFTIYSCSQRLYLNLIGFDHKQKREDILFNLSRNGGNYRQDSKKIILDLLTLKNLTAKQLSRLIGIRHSTILQHLNELKIWGEVSILKKEGWSNVWQLNI